MSKWKDSNLRAPPTSWRNEGERAREKAWPGACGRVRARVEGERTAGRGTTTTSLSRSDEQRKEKTSRNMKHSAMMHSRPDARLGRRGETWDSPDSTSESTKVKTKHKAIRSEVLSEIMFLDAFDDHAKARGRAKKKPHRFS